MYNILLIGNPNVGKSTLFNSLTKAHEHTGNFHGVTVSVAKREINFENEKYCVYDLPGMYSFLSFSNEEEVSKNMILQTEGTRLLITDANALRRNLYLFLQMKELGLDCKILINNYQQFTKRNNSLDVKLLSEILNCDIEIINAKKQKFSKNLIKINKNDKKMNKNNIFFENYLKNIVENIKNKLNLTEKQIIFALNGIYDGLKQTEIDYIKAFYPQIIELRYKYIDDVLNKCQKINYPLAYGENKLDKLILNPFFMFFAFIFAFFLIFYVIFFAVGPILSDLFINVLTVCILDPFINLLTTITDNIWLIEFFNSGVFSSFTTILSFLPQICLMYLALTILEDSGLIARLCYVVDDFLSGLGLNGKVIYLMLMGLGCNTLATLSARNMKGKNLKIKSAIINPYISCMARLPVYAIVASAIFKVQSFWIILGLYLLGFAVAIIMAGILNKTILPTKQGELLLEFPPLKHIDIKHCFESILTSALDMFKRLFSVVLSVGIIVWIVTHTEFNFHYTQDITTSMAYLVADKLSFVFAPIGLNSAGIVTALFVGLLAKELMVSTMSICNNALTRQDLMLSLVCATSVITFTPASAMSFLVFSLLYCPCVSNLAVLRKETGKFYMWFALVSQFTIGYVLAFIVYQTMTRGLLFTILALIIMALILTAVCVLTKKLRKGKCLDCGKCKT